MNSPWRFFVALLTMLGFLSAALPVQAQPLGAMFDSIEARVATAHHVVVGTISKITRQAADPPAGHGDSYQWVQYTIRFDVDEVLKGEAPQVIRNLEPLLTRDFDRRYETWAKRNRLVVFLGPEVGQHDTRSWTYLVLKDTEHGRQRNPPMFSSDLTVLKTEQEILRHASEYGSEFKGVYPTHLMRIPSVIAMRVATPGGWNDLTLPVDRLLERTAIQLIKSPEDLIEDNDKFGVYSRHELRVAGVKSLQYFKSQRNIELLRGVANEEHVDESIQPNWYLALPQQVLEVLLHWNVDVSGLNRTKSITSLDLAGTDVTDDALVALKDFHELNKINLRGTKVTDRGIKHLVGLPKLSLIEFQEDQLEDGILRVLNRANRLCVVSSAYDDGERRPRSNEDIRSISLCRGPLTDQGLKEIVDLKNLRWLDLRETQVTDAGLEQIAGLAKLERLLLHGTRVTPAGVDKLQKRLPKCDISI